MSTQLLNDLTAWESGDLELAEVEGRHPGADVTGLVEIHKLMVAAGTPEVPAVAESWEKLKSALPERGTPRSEMRARTTSGRWVRRPVVVATATMLLGGSALAMTSEPVREGVVNALRTVASIVNLDSLVNFDAGDSGEPGLDSGDVGDDAGTTGSNPGGNQGEALLNGAPGKRAEPAGHGPSKRQGPKAEPPGSRGAPGSVPGAPGNGPNANEPLTEGKGGSNGNSDSAGKPDSPGSSGDAGIPQGPGKSGGKGKGPPQDNAEPEQGETPSESGDDNPSGSANGNSGGNGIGNPGGNGGAGGNPGGNPGGSGNGNPGGNGNGGGG